MDFYALNQRILPPDETAARRAQARLNEIAKPVGSLGALEEDLVAIAALTGSEKLRLKPRAVLVMCADNGVAAPDIAITPVRVTRTVAEMMARGESNVCRMARLADAEVFPYDVGMFTRSDEAGLSGPHISDGTNSLLFGPAMTAAQAKTALRFGMERAQALARRGYRLLATGEMGVGNTTTSAAMAAVLLGRSPQEVTGRGSGLSNESLRRKIEVVEQAIRINKPDAGNAFDVLKKLGGYDIAAMAGVFIGGALARVPVLVDGVISAVAALTAARLCPRARACMLASHVSAEPAGRRLLEALKLKPLICAGLRLGEGTGAVTAMPMLDMALEIYDNMLTFSDIGM